jgi:hypothetical protein
MSCGCRDGRRTDDFPVFHALWAGERSCPGRSRAARHRSGAPRWDALITVAENENYPRLHVTWHQGHGFVVQCFEDGESWGFFLAATTSFSSPEIEIEMGGQALEKWPRQLFVNSERALEALGFFLQTGKQNGTQHWVRTDAFPRQVVWEGREGRAWERRQQS